MTLNLSSKTWAKVLLGVTAALLVLVAWAYLAGGIFLGIYGLDPNKATPLTLYQYAYYYAGQTKVVRSLYIAGGIAFVVVFVPCVWLFIPAKRKLFGDAKFASNNDIRNAGLFSEKGIILGRLGSKFLMFGGQSHVLVSAPTRGKKGVSVVIPNLLNWGDSVVVADMKQENFDITSGYRARCGQQCFLFNPAAADYRTHRYNPLAYISEDPFFRIDDIQKIGHLFYPDKPGVDVIWTATPRSLFLGIVLMLFETPGKPVTLGQVLRESLMDGDGAKYFNTMIEQRAKTGKPLSNQCVFNLRAYSSIASDNTRSGVIGSFRAKLEAWSNPFVDAATSANDFDLRDLRKKRMSIYVGITPDNLDRMRPVLNLFFQQLTDLNTRTLPERDASLKYQCLLLLDEFASLGKLDALSNGVSYIAGYGLRLLTIIQSPSQLISVYGKDVAATFTQNQAAQIVFAPKRSDVESAKAISEWLGYQTVKGVSESKSKGILAKRSPSESRSDQRRALLLPQEVSEIGADNEIVIVENCHPIMAKKAVYYKLSVFIDRLKAKSKLLAALGNKLPSFDQLKEAIKRNELRADVPKLNLDEYAIDLKKMDVLFGGTGGEKQEMSIVETVYRSVTTDDLLDTGANSLMTFAVDFSAVKKPVSGELDENGLREYANALCKEAGLTI